MKEDSLILTISIFGGVVCIIALSIILSDGFYADFLLNRETRIAPYPFTVQNLMWLVFFFGFGHIVIRYKAWKIEKKQLGQSLLPEDDSTVLRKEDLGTIYNKTRSSDKERKYFLQRLLSRCILQFQSSDSVNQVNTLFNSSLELYQHEIELKYNTLRYIVWLIPTLGFIGTVIGIALALSSAGAAPDFQDPQLLKTLTQDLGVAFYTTLLALVQSAILVFYLHMVQGREENVLNTVGQYCLDNLINRLYSKQGD